MICDAGLSIPPGLEVVDLAFVPDVPTCEGVLSGVGEEIVVENGQTCGLPIPRLPERDLVHHENLERGAGGTRPLVRTGESMPLANVPPHREAAC